MPSQTFFNLSDARKKEIIDISINEFISNAYHEASLNRIILTLGIAKGSFYRYFDSKHDLYEYLISYCINKKEEYLKQYIKIDENDIFEFLKDAISANMHFDLDNTVYSKFMLKIYNNNDLSLKRYLFVKDDENRLLQMICKSQEIGIFSKEYDSIFILNTIIQLIQGIIPYLQQSFIIDGEENISLTEDKFDVNKINSYFRQMINLLKVGLSVN